jgi:S-adenosylmethionine decarboxylase
MPSIDPVEKLSDEPSQFDSLSGFEGPEKLLEIWFKPLNSKNDCFENDPKSSETILDSGSEDGRPERPRGLRKFGHQEWQTMLDTVKCQILSSIHNEFLDAYLLR